MTDQPRDPLDILAAATPPIRPRAAFARRLRARLLDALDLIDDNDADLERATPTVNLPERKSPMSPMSATSSATTPATAAPTHVGTVVAVPYLTVSGGDNALTWYTDAFGAREAMRVADAEGRVGHAEFVIGDAKFYLSDEHPEYGVVSPSTLGGTSVALHLTVDDVDAVYARAVEAGATSLAEPADQAHGARHGTLIDPFGHRWMLSQEIERVDVDTYRDRAADEGYTVTAAATPRPPATGQIWAAMPYADARAGIRFLTEVLGFEEQIVVADDEDPSVVVHSQLRWPEGGVLQAATANRPGNVYSQRPVGSESLYVVTAVPEAVWQRCQAAGVDVVDPPSTPDYAPGTMNFSIRDPEGNIFTFGSYGGES